MFLRPGRKFLLAAIFSLLSVVVYAGNNPEYRQTLFGKNGQLTANAQLYTFDINYEAYKNTPGAIEKTWYVKNTVRLMIDEESSWFITSDFTASIKLNISSENAAGVVTNHPQKTLTIDYKTAEGQISGAISSYEFRDAVKVTVTIAEPITKNVSWDVTKNLKLVNEIISLRDWGFSCTTAITGVMTDSLFYDEWKVKWNVPANFQTEYDVEWAWIDESAVSEYTFNGSVNLDTVFESNATRVSTPNNYYRVPLLYEDNGRIYVRVRMAQDKVNGQRVEGSWYYLSDGGQAYLARAAGQGHEDNLNWQATTTFAEEGKRKTVIQYFDGTLRGRQTVTKDNVTRTTVVAESFYDYQGRPLIQVLPSPTLNTIIQFSKNLNQFDDTRNAKTVYDKLDINQSACNKLTAAMKTTASASAAQYYSANNPQVGDGFNKYIPDAGGYPYTETRYTSDGTGRIDAQGGVGQVFQVNGGRETRYYYESADQDDLDALFGTDAGYASHYSKTWVRDANGQYSVSYVDMKGKTVATALAGDNPSNLQSLPSFATATKTITRQLIDNETNNVQGNSIVSSKSLVVPKPGNYTFNYYLSPEKLKMWLCTGTQFCFDCQYELNISIIPDCSDKVIAGFTNPIVVKNFNLGEYLTSCSGNNSPLLDTVFAVWLEEGAYTVVKELKLNTAARDWYRENVYLTNDTCKTKASFVQQQYQLALNQMNCYTSCTQCNARLGSQQAFIDSFKLHSGFTQAQVDSLLPQLLAAYAEAKANCDRICDNNTGETLDELNSIRDIMLQDVTPLVGQYGRYDENDPLVTARPFNIFNPAPSVSWCPPAQSVLTQPYRYPVDYNPATGIVVCNNAGYKNAYGAVTLPNNRLHNINFSADSLADNFEDSYAYQLLPYHPEFPKLKFAEANLKGTYRFNGRLGSTETWNLAVSRGFIHTSTTNAAIAADYLMQKDSFFIRTSFTHPLYYQMRDAITTNYIAANTQCGSPAMSMWQLAKYSVFCNKEIKENGNQTLVNGCFTPNAALQACLGNQNNLPPLQDGSHCTADMDMVWKHFKTFYLSYRDILISQYLEQQTVTDMAARYPIFETSSGNNYLERFIRYENGKPKGLADLDGLLNGDPQTYNNVSLQEADSICRANSGNWMTRLRRCPQVEALALTQSAQWVADSTWLSKYLVDVCKQGVDYLGHPFGAASLPDGKPSIQLLTNPDGTSISGVYVRNFPDIVRYYLLHRFGSGSINQFCYPELIDYPKAYNVAPPTVITPVITVPEPCVCERINYFKTKWQNAGSPGTFSNYLLNTQGTSISQDTLNILINMCNTGYVSQNPNCNFLSAPIKIPAIFQCRGTATIDSSKTCITCADYTAIKEQFFSERGVAAPYDNPQTETELAWNRAFAEYANYKLGFSKLWPEYVQFGIICAGDTTLSCTNLNNLLAAWQATNPPGSGDSCRNSFTQYMNYHTGRNLTFNQWMDEFLKACGTKPPVCQPVLTCSRLESLINSYYDYYGYQIWRNSNCQALFTQFVNDSLYTNYTYQDIVNNYDYLCGATCPLNVCSFPNSHLLTKLYNHFKTQVYQSSWTLTECQDNFTSWFNTQLGFTANPYDWAGIVTLYQQFMGKESCVPDITQLCNPPYSCTQLDYIRQQFYALYPNADSLGNCQALFTQFFNQQMGTNYTFAEIQSIYSTVCLTSLQVCVGGTYWDCCDLILFYQQAIEQFNEGLACPHTYTFCQCFVAQFNSNYNTNYDYEQIRQLYLDHCGFQVMICGAEPPVFTCELLQSTLSAFVKQYPGGGGCNNCEQFFASYFNNRHGTLYTYPEINDLYLVQCGQALQVCNSKCPDYISFVNNFSSRYGSMKIPLQARRQLLESLFNPAFGYDGSSELNQPLLYSQIKALMTGCLTMPANLENENLNLTLNDASTLRDFKTAYYLRYPNGTPLDCQNDFTAWVNYTMGTTKTWCELVALYNSIVGPGSGDVCGKEAAEACSSGGGEGEKEIGSGGGGSTPPVSYPPMLCGLNVEIFTPPPVDTSACKDPLLFAITDANIKWELYMDSLRRNFDTAYYNKCMRAKYLESFTVSFDKTEHHYTLYYYDQAGQLVRTVPPEGVEDKRSDGVFLTSVKTARQTLNSQPLTPGHTLSTEYRYNTLGQVLQQKSPDGGLSKFWYDYLGRLVVSQNAQQALDGKYSYTLYDELGRIKEVGQKPQSQAMTQGISRSESALSSWLAGGSSKEQLTRTVYDKSYFDGDDLLKPEKLAQRNLRNRVSYTQVFDVQPSGNNYVGTHRAATYYTYDIHGNVDTLLQDYGSSSYYPNAMNQAGHRYKKIAYNYDLISGKVNMVSYQPGYVNPLNGEWVNNADRFYHRYQYDAENKLTDVYTSHDSLIWERDASYSYYKHGPLARVTIGQQQVQGVDYAYNLQGWLKGVNSTAIGDGTYDIGGDGKIGGTNALVARDAYGFSLNYFTSTVSGNTVHDYKAINGSVTPFVNNVFNLTNTDAATVGKPLFNGNIAAMMVNIPKLGEAQLYGYVYDQLNRIASMDAFTGLNNTNNTFTAAATANYKERVVYDANGNIKSYLRNGTTAGGTPQQMDNLTYGYNISGGKLVNNRLRHVKDAIGDGNYTEDIDNQPDDNYDYDAIGNLIKDTKEGITNISWSVYGKILSITKASGVITYSYDANGNRMSKSYNGKTTWYVRDGSGNVMSVYEQRSDLNSGHLTQSEIHLYGSSRLGIYNVNRDMISPPTEEISIFERGKKLFELSNHLGNVLVTISDRKLQVSSGGITVDYYTADVVTATDYYPFGMDMPGRQFGGFNRYGFNGKERDKNMHSLTAYDYGFRIYNPAIGKFLSMDPLFKSYAMLTPYQFASNRPIDGIDLDGLEFTKFWKRDKISKRAQALMKNPEAIRQAGGTCVIAAITYLWIKSDKQGFYNTVMNLYDKGEATYNNFDIEPGSHLFDLDPSNVPKKLADQGMSFNTELLEKGADWIIISSIQDSKNEYNKFYGLKGDKKGEGTSKRHQKELMSDLLGYSDIVVSDMEDRTDIEPASIMQDIQKKFKEGYSIIISCQTNLALSTSKPIAEGDKKTEDERHAFVYLGDYSVSKNEKGETVHKFKIQTWGTEKYVSKTDAEFKKYYKGYVAGKK